MDCFFIVTIGWIFSVCLHEFGHAWAAYRGGDYTVREKGYLTMNPLKYVHPLFSLGLPVLFLLMGGIGLPGAAVYINRHLLRSRGWETWVSLAGPAMNVGLILLIGLAFRLGLIPQERPNLALVSLAFLLHLEISSLLLCLIPVPPLDGFQAIAPWLARGYRERLYALSNYGIFIVFIALSFMPAVNRAFWDAVYWISGLMGVEPYWGRMGWRAFRFWVH